MKQFLVGLAESFLPGVLSVSVVFLNTRYHFWPVASPAVFWWEIGFIVAAILAFPLYNATRRNWLELAGGAAGILLLAPTYMVLVWIMLSLYPVNV